MNRIKAIGYGRKSFDDPKKEASSVADQEVFARAYADRHGFDMIAFHGDNYITGATMERPSLQAMLAAFKRGEAQILVIEDIDRLSRDIEHFHYMAKLFRLYDVKVHTVAVGFVDDLAMSFQALMGEHQRKRIAYATRRGLKGKAKRGGATGGKTLGYTSSKAENESDRLLIVEDEAALVRRLFELYALGHSLKQICDILNRDGIPSPRSRETGRYNAGLWNPSTLSGSIEYGEGILNNELYVGHRVFNKRTWVEVPTENRGFRRLPRLNPESEWIVRDEPDLRIIGQELWDRVKARQQEARQARDAHFKISANPLAGAKPPSHILSGLVECGACGRPFLATGGGRWRCKGHRHGQCENGLVTTKELEDRVLAGIRDRLLTPALVSRFASALQKELGQAQKASNADRSRIEVKLDETRDRIARLVHRLEDEDDAPRALVQRLKALEAEEQAFATELAAAPAPTVIRLPGNPPRATAC